MKSPISLISLILTAPSSPRTGLLALIGSALLFSSGTLLAEKPGDFRDFKSTNGKTVAAKLVDKNDTEVKLKLKDGGRVITLKRTRLSKEDLKFVDAWDKEKMVFLESCRTLSIRELLEVRGYEAFDFQLEGNHIIVEGKLNEMPAKFLIDTGAGTSLLHLDSAKEAKCDVGPMDQRVAGIGGYAPAANTKIDKIQIGQSLVKNIELLAADLLRNQPKSEKVHDAIFGAEFLKQLKAVIDYRENRIFLRPDLASDTVGREEGQSGDFRLFRTRTGKVLRGKIKSRTVSAITLDLTNGKESQLLISSLIEEDADYAYGWSEERNTFIKKCKDLTVKDLLELREYETFKFDMEGNHIFLPGKLNGNDIRYMIDTGAGTSMLHSATAEKADCTVGPYSERVHGVAGSAPAAPTKVPSVEIGKSKLQNRILLSVEEKYLGGRLNYGGIFGADYMRELDAVINYHEGSVFLRP